MVAIIPIVFPIFRGGSMGIMRIKTYACSMLWLGVLSRCLCKNRVLRHGFWRLVAWVKALCRHKSITTEIEGVRFCLDLGEVIDSSIFFEGAWEIKSLEKFRKLIKQGQSVVDIGANMGFFTLHFAKLVGKGGQVLAFEPMANGFERLQRNLGLNPSFASVVRVERVALSNEDVGPQDHAFNTSWKLGAGDDPQVIAEKVQTMKLDSYFKEFPPKRFDWMKLDV
jgi:FkbM family methyltransferase